MSEDPRDRSLRTRVYDALGHDNASFAARTARDNYEPHITRYTTTHSRPHDINPTSQYHQSSRSVHRSRAPDRSLNEIFEMQGVRERARSRQGSVNQRRIIPNRFAGEDDEDDRVDWRPFPPVRDEDCIRFGIIHDRKPMQRANLANGLKHDARADVAYLTWRSHIMVE